MLINFLILESQDKMSKKIWCWLGCFPKWIFENTGYVKTFPANADSSENFDNFPSWKIIWYALSKQIVLAAIERYWRDLSNDIWVNDLVHCMYKF